MNTELVILAVLIVCVLLHFHFKKVHHRMLVRILEPLNTMAREGGKSEGLDNVYRSLYEHRHRLDEAEKLREEVRAMIRINSLNNARIEDILKRLERTDIEGRTEANE